MPADFYPKREDEIVNFTGNFSIQISAAPGAYGLTTEQAAQYATAQQAFADLHQLSTQGSTNTSSVVAGKRNARSVLERMTRLLARIIRGQQGLTAEQRIAVGLPLRDRGRPRGSRNRDGRLQLQRIGPPRIRVLGVQGRTVRVRLCDRYSLTSRSKPDDVTSATLFSYVGEIPPAPEDLVKWKFERMTTRTVVSVRPGGRYESLPPGTRVWIIAFWENRRSQRGPLCEPVYAHTQYGVEVDAKRLLRAAA